MIQGTNGWIPHCSWWRHQMETFSALQASFAGNPPFTGEFPSQRPVTRIFDVFFDLRLNKRMSKQSKRSWFETQLDSSWRHCNGYGLPSGTNLLYSLSGMTSYRQISRSLEAARFDVISNVSLWNLTDISAALLPMCQSNLRAIGKSQPESPGFETSRDLGVRRLPLSE